jgi:hypothetical protein
MTTACVVFSGPSLPPSAAQSRLPGARCLGPAACGDILRAQQAGARWIVLIDGFFEHTRSVWHKEILWALAHGVRVYGAASLGALRALELERFGMLGVGQVFEWFRAGVLEDDDEVALVHEAADRDYKPKSDALVNMRVTLAKAVDYALLTPAQASQLLSAQKARFYPLRSYVDMLAASAGQLSEPERARLSHWLRAETVDQKRLDACAVLARVQSDMRDNGGTAAAASFDFSYTEAWHEFVRRHGAGA